MVQHHPSDEALVSPFRRNRDNLLSITSHLKNGVDGVCEFANAWGGGVQNRWRDRHSGERSASPRYSKHCEQNTDNNSLMNAEYEYKSSLSVCLNMC